MLSSLSGKKNRVVLYIILGLLVIGLIGFGGDQDSGLQRTSIGQVGEEEISLQVYANAVQNNVNQVSQRIGRRLTLPEAEQLGIIRNVTSQVVAGTALDNETKQMGLSIGDVAVAAEIRRNPAFQALDGQFTQENYQAVLQNSGITSSAFEANTRRILTRGLLETGVIGGVELDQTYAENLANYAQEIRSFEWATLDETWLPSTIAEPTETQLSEFYTDNINQFSTELIRRITYIHLSPERMFAEIALSDAELRADYNAQLDRFERPAARLLERIALSDAAQAALVKSQIEDGTFDFDALLEARGLDASLSDLGAVERGALDGDAQSIFDSDELGVYGPFDSLLGPVVYRVNAVIDEQVISFEDARAELEADAKAALAQGLMADLIEEVDDLLAAGATLEEIASTTPAVLGQIDLTPETTSGIAAYDEFRTIANATNVGNFPEVFDLSDGGAFAMRVNEIFTPRVLTFREAQSAVRQAWDNEQRVKLLEQQGEKLADLLRTGSQFSSLGLDAQTAVAQRGEFVNNLDPEVIQAIFDIDLGDVLVQVSNNTVFIARLDSITLFDPTEDEAIVLLEQVNQALSSSIAADILTLYADAVQTRAGVQLDQAVINSVNTQIFSGYGN